MFSLKDKNPYPSCVIYEGTCNCGENYIGETVRNASVRWNEHEEPKKDSEPEKHLRVNIEHTFKWKVLMCAPKNSKQRKNLEASIISINAPSLNNQLETKILTLFRHAVT